MLKNPLDKVIRTKVVSAVTNDMPGVCPICMEHMEILDTGNDTKAYVCIGDRVCLPVQNDAIQYSSDMLC